MLGMRAWRGDEQVLDVGCGRGLLLAGAGKRVQLPGTCTGMDIWSGKDMGGNSVAATRRNLELEGFDVVVSNLCLHNISSQAERRKAVQQIARVLKPGGEALISDFKLTSEYAGVLRDAGLSTRRVWGSLLFTFPPLRVVVARKPAAG